MTSALNHLQQLNGNKLIYLLIKSGNTYRALLFSISIMLSSVLFSQSDTLKVHQINGKNFYIHVAEKGNTLYAISKMYDVPQDVIKKENPGLSDGISIGEKIFIPVKRHESQPENTVDGNYIEHTVTKKQTLYSISNEYKVKQKEIIAANPEIKDGLKEGQIIKIPVVSIKDVDGAKQNEPEHVYKTHVVKKGETLYALSKLYNVSQDSIKIVNNGLKKGLRVDETINIPIKRTKPKEISVKSPDLTQPSLGLIDTLKSVINKKGQYEVAVMLPFYIEENRRYQENKKVLDKKDIYPKSKYALELYKGIKLAFDSLTDDSCKFKLHVYDTGGKDSLKLSRIMSKPELQSVDLIIGPLYYDNFKTVAAFAKEYQIPIVATVKQSNKLLLGNQYVFKIIPSVTSQVNALSAFGLDSMKQENVNAVSFEYSKEKSLADQFVKGYNDRLLDIDDTLIYPPAKLIPTSSRDASVITNNLVPNKNNVFFIPSNDQSYVSGICAKLISFLNIKKNEDYQITLIGLEGWLNFQNVDLEYYNRLNVHVVTGQHINYEDSLTNNLVHHYYNHNETYPTLQSITGFDIAYTFGTYLKANGENFSAFIESKGPVETNHNAVNIDFFKTGIESGFENRGCFVVRIKDYKLEQVY